MRVASEAENRKSLGLHWLVPEIEFGLLACLIAGDPAHLAHRRRRLRRIAIAVVIALAATTLVAS